MKLRIRNFRSIQDQAVDLGPITVVYGPTGSGKSSLIYALLALKNVLMNPNQNSSGFFNYGFASLGAFESVVFDHVVRNNIGLSLEDSFGYAIGTHEGQAAISLVAEVGKEAGALTLSAEMPDVFEPSTLRLPIQFPYPGNQQVELPITVGEWSYTVSWNGIVVQVRAPSTDAAIQDEATCLAELLERLTETLRSLSIVPLKRGFTKPHYSTSPLTPTLLTEDEVATVLSNKKHLVSKVSHYFEKILRREFRVNVTPGTAVFTLDSTDKTTGVLSELVNDGFGANQIVYILAKCLDADVRWVCLEEPEIHLHPTAIRNLAKALVEITYEEDKRFVISTHSEALISAFLSLVASGQLQSSDLFCYFTQKDRKVTSFECQRVSSNGQIEGGLSTFVQAELDDVRSFLKITD